MRFGQSLVLVIALLAPGGYLAVGAPEKARIAFHDGQALLEQGDFEGALSAFKTAAKGQRSNEEYGQQYALLRQVVELRKKLPKEKDAERWLSGAIALHTFYHEQGLYDHSLPLDEERYRRAPTADSALLLAQTQLALGRNASAVELLAGLKPDARTLRTDALQALGLARVGRFEEAKALLAHRSEFDGEAGPDCFLDHARAWASVGEPKKSLHFLRRSIELTPPSQLEDYKARVSTWSEFSALAGTAEFSEVLKTASTIKESPCSGGTGCSKCPKRSKCGSSKPVQAPEKQ